MKDSRWPTQQELMEYVDGALDPQRFLEIDQLVVGSSKLRKEIAMLKMMRQSIAADVIAPRRSFTADIMSEIDPVIRPSVWYRLANNSSNIFAMTLVLSMIGIVLFAGPGTSHGERSIIANAMDSYSSAVSSVMEALGSRTKEVSQPITKLGQSSSGKLLLIATGIFFLFAVLDETLGKRYFRIRK